MRSVVVTGASRGLGLAIARRLAGGGWRVIAVARRESDQLTAAAQEFAGNQAGSLHFKPFDLEKVGEIPAMVKELRKEFGSIYALVNNAGLGTSGMLATMHDAQIERLVRLNVLSPLTLTKYVVRSMMAGRRRAASSTSPRSSASPATAACPSTAPPRPSLIGFTRSLAREVGRSASTSTQWRPASSTPR